MTDINDNLKESAAGALADLFAMAPIEDGYLTSFLEVLKGIRAKNLVLETNKSDLTRLVFDAIRMDKVFFTDLMAASSSFALSLADRDLAIQHYVSNCQAFTVSSQIVDKALIERIATGEEITGMLRNNMWLFFLFYLSSQEKMVFDALVEAGRGTLVKQHGRKAR
jgi:hypothetical protein